MSSMESLDKLQAELSGNVYGDAFHTLYKLSQDVSVEHSELMAQAMKWVHKEKVEPLEAENAKLRERAVAMLSELRGVVSEGDYDSPSGRYFLLRRDVAAYEDALRELGIELDG